MKVSTLSGSENLLVSNETYEEAIAYLNGTSQQLFVDTEGKGLRWYLKSSYAQSVQVLAGDRAFYFPFRHVGGGNLDEGKLADFLHRVLPPDRRVCGHNWPSHDYKMLAKEGMQRPDECDDTAVGAYLLDENNPMKLESLGKRFVDPNIGDAEDVLLDVAAAKFDCSRKNAKAHMWKLPVSDIAQYGLQDVYTCRALREIQRKSLEAWRLNEVYEGWVDYHFATSNMQMNGILLNVQGIYDTMAYDLEEADRLSAIAAIDAGYPINLDSPKQCQAWLRVKSTKKDILEALVLHKDPKVAERARLLQAYRIHSKACGTYHQPFLRWQNHGRLYPQIRPTGTAPGRPTCTDPNLYALPRDTVRYRVKHNMIAPEGKVIVELDWNQVEIALMLHYTGDINLARIVCLGLSMHDEVARLNDMPRQTAKRLNLSAQYGIGAAKFAASYGYTLQEAKAYLRQYDRTFPGMKRLYRRCDTRGKTHGYVRYWTGKVRHFTSGGGPLGTRPAPSHKGSSNVVQGGVAEMYRIGLCRIDREVPEFEPILGVYDSFIGYVDADKAPEVIPRVVNILEDQPWCNAPITVDVKQGLNLGDAEKVPYDLHSNPVWNKEKWQSLL